MCASRTVFPKKHSFIYLCRNELSFTTYLPIIEQVVDVTKVQQSRLPLKGRLRTQYGSMAITTVGGQGLCRFPPSLSEKIKERGFSVEVEGPRNTNLRIKRALEDLGRILGTNMKM